MIANDPLNFLDGDMRSDLADDGTNPLFRQVEIDRAVLKRRAGQKTDQASFELADIRGDIQRDELDDCVWKFGATVAALFPEDGYPCLEVRGLHVGSQSGLKS